MVKLSMRVKRGAGFIKFMATGGVTTPGTDPETLAFTHEELEAIIEEGSWRDPKSHLQEVSQRIDGATPQYKVLEEIGPDHDKVFTLGVYVAGKLKGKGTGHSKQMAQQKAAQAALKVYQSQEAGVTD